MPERFIDLNGRECRPGDLIRIYHYRDRSTGRKVYMYKLVVLCDKTLRINKEGKYFFAVSIEDIWKSGGLSCAHKCRLEVCEDFEIICGLSQMIDGTLETWYERPRSTISPKTEGNPA